jgi:hypothetical protein
MEVYCWFKVKSFQHYFKPVLLVLQRKKSIQQKLYKLMSLFRIARVSVYTSTDAASDALWNCKEHQNEVNFSPTKQNPNKTVQYLLLEKRTRILCTYPCLFQQYLKKKRQAKYSSVFLGHSLAHSCSHISPPVLNLVKEWHAAVLFLGSEVHPVYMPRTKTFLKDITGMKCNSSTSNVSIKLQALSLPCDQIVNE